MACKQLCFPPGKSVNRRNESAMSELFRAFRENNSESSRELLRIFLKLFRTVLNLLQNECIIIIDWYYWRYLTSLHLFTIYPLFSNTDTVNLKCSQITGGLYTQVSEEIEGRVTKKLSHEFSRTEIRILGALAKLDDFLMNPLLQGHSGTTPETSRNMFS